MHAENNNMRVRELSEKCIKAGIRVSTAESCTGGLIASECTALPGASAWFAGGIVSYLESVKTGMLHVPGETIEKYGVVSGPVAEAMAENMRLMSGTDIAVSVTGYAGPGGSAAGPSDVGTVYIGLSSKFSKFNVRYFLKGSRSEIRRSAAAVAIGLMCDEAGKFADR